MSQEIRYLDISQVDLSRILIKENSILYQYPDGIKKKLYIKTPYLPINPTNKNNKLKIDITNTKYFYENLMNKINELRHNNIDTNNTLIFDESDDTNKKLLTIYFNKNKTEIIKHNISLKYPKIEIIKEDIYNVIKKINFSKKYEMEAMFIFTPIIYMNNNMLITYKMEIKYKNQNIKSYLQSKEIDIDYVDKLKKIVVEL